MAVQVTIVTPIGNIAGALFVMVTFGSQLSVAVAVPRLNSKEHVMIAAGHVITGGVVSTMVKVAELVDVFPQASLAVKVTTAKPVEPHRLLSEVKSFDQVTVPEQISEATAPPLEANHAFNAAVFPLPSHSTLWLEAWVVTVGGVVSTMVKVAELVEVFPQASLAVKLTTAEPVEPQRSLSEVKSFDQVTIPEQISEASAPPLEFNQAFNASEFPSPSHSTLWLEAWVVIVGGVVSTMVKVAELVEVFPQASLAVKVTTAEPVAPQRSLSEVKSFDQVIPEQLSKASAPPLEANHAFRSVVFPLPSHSTLWLEAWVVMVGAILSFTIIICVH